MNRLPLLYATADDELDNRLQVYLGPIADLFPHVGPVVGARLHRFQPCVFIVDVRIPDTGAILKELAAIGDRACPVIVLAVPGSTPWRDAAARNIFAIEAIDVDGVRLRRLVERAFEWLEVVAQAPQKLRELPSLPAQPERRDHLSLRFVGRALRYLDDDVQLWGNLLEGVCESLRVSRAGVFMHTAGQFALLSGRHAVSGTDTLQFDESDALVSWLEDRRQLLTLGNVVDTEPPVARALTQSMRLMGADAVVPIEADGQFCGWLYVGSNRSGGPLPEATYDELATWGELASGMLNAAYRQRQASRAYSLLQRVPLLTRYEILAVTDDAVVVMGIGAAQYATPGAELDRYDIKLAGTVRTATIDCQKRNVPCLLRGSHESTALIVPLSEHVEDIAALVVIGDAAPVVPSSLNGEPSELILEMRNRLVAVNTFIQLLPERGDDAKFREDFIELVTKELSIINSLVVNRLAAPKRPSDS